MDYRTWSARVGVVSVTLLGCEARCQAQAFNVDLEASRTDPKTPSGAYGGAGLQPGFWTPVFYGEGQALRGLDGSTTSATVDVFSPVTGGTRIAGTSADDNALMNDLVFEFNPVTSTPIFVRGLLPGKYRLVLYGWVRFDNRNEYSVRDPITAVPAFRTLQSGPTWPGKQTEGTTFFNYNFEITDQSQFLVVEALNHWEGETPKTSAMNGFQIVPIPAPISVVPLLGLFGSAVHRRRDRGVFGF